MKDSDLGDLVKVTVFKGLSNICNAPIFLLKDVWYSKTKKVPKSMFNALTQQQHNYTSITY